MPEATPAKVTLPVSPGSTIKILRVSPWWKFWDRRVRVQLRLGVVTADLDGVLE